MRHLLIPAATVAALLVSTSGCDAPPPAAPPDHAEHDHAAANAAPRDHEGHDHAAAEAEPVDWCAGHGLPESACTKCNPELVEQFRAAGDWCAGHGFPESVCPLCNPQAPPEGAGPGQVQLGAGVAERNGIRVDAASSQTADLSLEITAEVRLDEDRVAHVSAPVPAQVVEVMAALGERVEAGAPLVRLRSVDLGSARADLARASALLDVARRDLERQQQLRAEGINSARALYEAELAVDTAEAERSAARSRLEVLGVDGGRGAELVLTSPVDGVVLDRHATRGENVSPADELFVVADVSRVWVIGQVYENQLSRVSEGMAATLRLDAWPGRTWRGEVDFVGAVLDERTRSLPVRVALDNADGALRPGLYGALRLQAGEGVGEGTPGPGVTVPAGAVVPLDEGPAVFVPLDVDGAFEARPVETGREAGGAVEIVAGLTAGERYVAEGAFVLKSELMRHVLGDSCVH